MRKKVKAFDICVTAILVLAGLVVLYPQLFVLVASISDPNAVNRGEVLLWPIGIHWDGYIKVLQNEWILTGYRNSLIYTFAGTTLNVLVTMLAAYALSRKDLVGRKFWNWYIAIPMWFGGGLIATYLTVYKLGLVGNPLVLILMGLVSPYNLIIARTFISGLPYELQEAAKIDGASDFQIIRKVIFPISASIIAVLSLYYAVGHWNNYFNSMIYIGEKKFQTLQVFLREFLLLNQNVDTAEGYDADALAEQIRLAQTMKYSLIVVASAPLLIVYPLLQKYFVKGVLVGSVKG